MNKGLAEYSLSELIDVIHGFAFKGEYFVDEPTLDILVTPGNFAIGGGFKSEKLKYYSGPIPQDYVLNEGELVLTMTDLSKQADTLGFPALIPKSEGLTYLHNQRIGRVEIKAPDKVCKEYLYYLCCSKPYRNEVLSSATGSTVKHTSPKKILAFKHEFPDLDIQYRVADVLGKLDDKIELNRKINANLEAIAQTIFRSWFVDFDPVHAKARGEKPKSMDAETAALFPSEFVDSELGMIPKGWEATKLSNVIELIGGGTPKKSNPEYWDGDILWFSVKDTPSDGDVFVIDTEDKITQKGLSGSSTKLLPEGTTIITARGTVGKLGLVGVPMAMNQSCYGVNSSRGNYPYFNFLNLQRAVEALQKNTHGAVFDTITRNTFDSIPQIMPTDDLVVHFEDKVKNMFMQIKSNLLESRGLMTIRDSLLPKLLSGDLDV